MDIDLTTLSNQALNTDGIVTLSDGSSWTKAGSAQSTAHPWEIVNGNGLRISRDFGSGDAVNGFASNILGAPTIWPNMTGLGTTTGEFYFPIRLTAIFATPPQDANNGSVGIAVEARDSASRSIASARKTINYNHFDGAAVRLDGLPGFSISDEEDFVIDNYTRLYDLNTLCLYLPGGLFGPSAHCLLANSIGNVFPTNLGASFQYVAEVNRHPMVGLPGNLAVTSADNWKCSIISSNCGPDSVVWVTRFKVEAFY